MNSSNRSDFFQKLSVVNQLIRTTLLLAVAGGIGAGGYWAYYEYVLPAQELASVKEQFEQVNLDLIATKRQLEAQSVQLQQLADENDRLQTSLRLVKVDRRLAYLTVTDTGQDPESGEAIMKVLFTEVDSNGKQVGDRRVFTLRGTLLNVDCWLAKFDDQYIEKADLVRGASLCIIRGIRGDRDVALQGIDEGIAYPDPEAAQADQPADSRPAIYQSLGAISDLEQKIWSDFWRVANDNALQQELGLRAVHGQVNYIMAEPGATYQLDLRASDGGSIRKVDQPPVIALPNPDDA
jgi:hypothetical protein